MYTKFLNDKSGNKRALHDKYKNYRNRLTSLLKAAEKGYYANKLLQDKNNSRKVWQTINKMIGKSTHSPTIPEIELNVAKITDPAKTADNFNHYFSNLGPSLARSITPSLQRPAVYLQISVADSIFLSPVTPSEIVDHIALMKNSTSKGYDDIALGVLKHTAIELSGVLAQVFNMLSGARSFS